MITPGLSSHPGVLFRGRGIVQVWRFGTATFPWQPLYCNFDIIWKMIRVGGRHGLPWFLQMTGSRVQLHICTHLLVDLEKETFFFFLELGVEPTALCMADKVSA